MVNRARARAYDGSTRRVSVIVHGAPYDPGEVELTVAVRMGTWKLEESLRRWIKKM